MENKYITRSYRVINETNIVKYVCEPMDLQWDHWLTPSDANVSYNNFLKYFGATYNSVVPSNVK